MKIATLFLAMIIAIPAAIYVLVGPRAYDAREYLGKSWSEISRADGEFRGMDIKGFAFKERGTVFVDTLQVNFPYDGKQRIESASSSKRIILFDTTLIADRLYIEPDWEDRCIEIWLLGRFKVPVG